MHSKPITSDNEESFRHFASIAKRRITQKCTLPNPAIIRKDNLNYHNSSSINPQLNFNPRSTTHLNFRKYDLRLGLNI